MRSRGPVGAAVAIGLAGVLLGAPMLMLMVVLDDPTISGCGPMDPGGGTVLAAGAGEGVGGLTESQLQHAATIITEGVRRGVPSEGIVVALAAASQESGYRVYANDGRGGDLAPDQAGIAASLDLPHEAVGTDHGSLGVFQQQWPWWGTMIQLMDPATAAGKFYRALMAVAGWEGMSVTQAAQAVQRSAYPDAYADDEPLARDLLAALGDDAGAHAVDAAAYNASCAQPAVLGSGRVVYPLPAGSGYVDRQNFGDAGGRWSRRHTGTDFSVGCGTAVLAAHGGTVIVDTTQSWAGPQLVKVTLGAGRLTTWYAHMQAVDVTDGEQVLAGQRLGAVGSEGNSTGCHLHFEVHPTGGSIYQDSVNPTDWLRRHVGAGIAVVPAGYTHAGPPPAGTGIVTMLSYNIRVGAHHGRTLPAVAREIASAGADIVVLNEIDSRRGEPPQATWLARRLGMHGVYGPNANFHDVRRRGNAILSEYPIVRSTNTRLPWRPGTEPRGLVQALIDVGGTVVRVTGTHLQPASRMKLVQARTVARLLGAPECPTFLLGDMNATPRSPEHRALTRHLRDPISSGRFGDGLTHPRSRPRGRIDYTLASPQARPIASRVMPPWTSDHRAVRTSFQLDTETSCA